MNENIREESHYCTSCGAVNKKSAVFCEECNKKIVIRHRPFFDFLKKHGKSGVAGGVTEKIFSLVKDFLFEHLYGIVLTVSVVATVTTVVATSTPYIKKVTAPPSVITTPAAEELPEEYGVFELTEDDIIWLDHVISSYDAEIDYQLRTGVSYWSHDEYYSSSTELWAENNIEGYTYKGRHEMYENPIPMGQDILDNSIYEVHKDEWDAEKFDAWHRRYTPVEGIRTGSNVRSELGHTLLADGYDVMEVDFYCLTYNSYDMVGYEFDMKALPPADKIPYEKYVYTFLLTRKHGEDKWYIAEEILTEKTGGQRG